MMFSFPPTGWVNVYSPDLELKKNIYSAEEELTVLLKREKIGEVIRGFTNLIPFPIVVCADYIPGGKVVCGVTGSPEFYIYSVKNNSVKRIEGNFEPDNVTGEDKEKYFDDLFTRAPGFSDAEIRKMKKKVTFPKVKIPYKSIMVDDSGYIIFETHNTEEAKGIECILYDFEGNYIKKIYFREFPEEVTIKDGKYYGILKTEEGWSRVVRYN